MSVIDDYNALLKEREAEIERLRTGIVCIVSAIELGVPILEIRDDAVKLLRETCPCRTTTTKHGPA